jgi:hypothetical protein
VSLGSAAKNHWFTSTSLHGDRAFATCSPRRVVITAKRSRRRKNRAMAQRQHRSAGYFALRGEKL